MESNADLIFERFKKECTVASNTFQRMLQKESLESFREDLAFLEDSVGIIAGFNRSMKYLLGNKYNSVGSMPCVETVPGTLSNSSNETSVLEDISSNEIMNKLERFLQGDCGNDQPEDGNIHLNSNELNLKKVTQCNDVSTAEDIETSTQGDNNGCNLLDMSLTEDDVQSSEKLIPTESSVNCCGNDISTAEDNRFITICSEGILPSQPTLQTRRGHPCLITYVDSPGKFHVSLNQYRDSNNSIFRDMNQFYKENHSHIVKTDIQMNKTYAYYHKDKWIRVIAKELVEDNSINVYFVDYGNEDKVNKSTLLPLKTDYKSLMPMAFECHLLNIYPNDMKLSWDEASKEFMKKKCLNKKAMVSIHERDRNNSLGVLLSINGKPIHFQLLRKELGSMMVETQFVDQLQNMINKPIGLVVADEDLSIPQIIPLRRGVPSECEVTHFIDPSNFYIKLTSVENNQMLEDLDKCYRNLFPLNKDKVGKTCFAALHEKLWSRATIVNKSSDSDNVEIYLLDIGLTTKVPYSALKPLFGRFCRHPPMAHKCHMYGIVPVNGVWSKKALRQIEKAVRESRCTVSVCETTDSSSGVVIEVDGKSANHKIVMKGFGVLTLPSTNLSSDVIPELMNEPMGADEEDVDFSLAVQGFSANDEAEICPHYKGPPRTTCFKGLKCKKKHQLMNLHGWTVKKVPTLMEIDQFYPQPDTKIQLLVTAMINYKSFYGCIVKHPNSSKIPVLEEMGKLNLLQASLNNPDIYKSYVTYDKLEILPGIGELVIAYFSITGQWYRAKICNVDEQECEVFYIDYGNKENINLKCVAQMDNAFSLLPPQATCFVIDNIDLPAGSLKQHTAGSHLFTLVADKLLLAHVMSIQSHEIHVLLYDNDQDIGEYMCRLNLVNEKTCRIIRSEDTVQTPDAIRLFNHMENRSNSVSKSKFLGLFPG